MPNFNKTTEPKSVISHVDFDGLISCFLIKQIYPEITKIQFATSSEMREKICNGTEIVLDLPHPKGKCHTHFDHHKGSLKLLENKENHHGRVDDTAPSCARVIFNSFPDELKQFSNLVNETDKIDCAEFTQEDVKNPSPASIISLSLIAGDVEANNILKLYLLEVLKTKSLEEISHVNIIQKRWMEKRENSEEIIKNIKVRILNKQKLKFLLFEVERRLPKNIIFKLYQKYPDTQYSIKITNNGGTTNISLGENIFHKKKNRINIGRLMAQYEGGGNESYGSCNVDVTDKESFVAKLIKKVAVLNEK